MPPSSSVRKASKFKDNTNINPLSYQRVSNVAPKTPVHSTGNVDMPQSTSVRRNAGKFKHNTNRNPFSHEPVSNISPKVLFHPIGNVNMPTSSSVGKVGKFKNNTNIISLLHQRVSNVALKAPVHSTGNVNIPPSSSVRKASKFKDNTNRNALSHQPVSNVAPKVQPMHKKDAHSYISVNNIRTDIVSDLKFTEMLDLLIIDTKEMYSLIQRQWHQLVPEGSATNFPIAMQEADVTLQFLKKSYNFVSYTMVCYWGGSPFNGTAINTECARRFYIELRMFWLAYCKLNKFGHRKSTHLGLPSNKTCCNTCIFPHRTDTKNRQLLRHSAGNSEEFYSYLTFATIGMLSNTAVRRVAEHAGKSFRSNNPLSNPPHSSIRQHTNSCKCQITLSNFAIIGSAKSDIELRILESIHIYKKRPSLNDTLSSYPLAILN
ncbi:hypothetical protein GQR58_005604 [Nymphon striatum]|nr:hypothetical protein GQR58_005604 [Nymphon striatum]